MSKAVEQMFKKLSWIIWLILVILWNYGFPQATPLQDVIVAVFLSILFIIINASIKILEKKQFKEAKRKARIEQRRARKSSTNPKQIQQDTMHDINKPITLEDLTNPDKNQL